MASTRAQFTKVEDMLFTKYIAKYNPIKSGRLGNLLYQRLANNEDGKWPWSSTHSWQSWRDRYKSNEQRFDHAIKKYQKKHGISDKAGDYEGARYRSQPFHALSDLDTGDSEDIPTEIPSQKSGKSSSGKSARKSVVLAQADSPLDLQQDASRGAQRQDIGAGKGKKTDIEQKRKPADETDGDAANREEALKEKKRRKVDKQGSDNASETTSRDDQQQVQSIPRLRSDGQVNANIENPKHTSDTPKLKQIDVNESVLDVDLSRLGDASARQNITDPRNSDLKTTVNSIFSRMDEEKRAALFKELGVTENTQKALFDQLGLNRPVPPSAQVVSSGDHIYDDEANKKPLYPDLSEFKMQLSTSEEGVDHTVPGAFNAAMDVNEPHHHLLSERKQHNASQPDAESSKSAMQAETPQPVSKANVFDKATLRRLVEEIDYFGSSPPSAVTMPPISEPWMPDPQAAPFDRTSCPVSARKREPPQLISGAFKTSYVAGVRASSFKRAPDMDSDSDLGDGTASKGESWPPRRVKKDMQATVTGKASTTTMVDASEKVFDEPPPSNVATRATTRQNSRTYDSEGGRLARDIPKAGPSRLQLDDIAAGDTVGDIQAWRSQTHAQSPSVGGELSEVRSASTSLDPFLTTEHARQLRAAKQKGTARADDVTANRRQTFGGFSSAPDVAVPDIDLRRRVGRNSLAAQQAAISFSPARSIQKRRISGGNLSRRDFIASTISLFSENPLPQGPFSPEDQSWIILAGVEKIINDIAENHLLNPDVVRIVYERTRSLKRTDQIAKRMRDKNEQILADALDQVDSESFAESASIGNEAMLRQRSTPKQRHGKKNLWITPINQDEGPVRVLERYSPPLESRASQVNRLSSEGRKDEAMKRERRRASLTGPLIPARSSPMRSSPLWHSSNPSFSNSGMAKPIENNVFAPAEAGAEEHRIDTFSPKPAPSTSVKQFSKKELQRPWTAEEDEIIRDGEDFDALREIEQRRGKDSVKLRTVQLMKEGLLF